MENLINQIMSILAAGAGTFANEAAKASAQSLIQILKEKLTGKTAQKKLNQMDKEELSELKGRIEMLLKDNREFEEEIRQKVNTITKNCISSDGSGNIILQDVKGRKITINYNLLFQNPFGFLLSSYQI